MPCLFGSYAVSVAAMSQQLVAAKIADIALRRWLTPEEICLVLRNWQAYGFEVQLKQAIKPACTSRRTPLSPSRCPRPPPHHPPCNGDASHACFARALLPLNAAGTLLLYDTNKLKAIRQDEIAWQTKKRGSGVREDHLKLKVNHKPMIYACYAHGATTTVRALRRDMPCCSAVLPPTSPLFSAATPFPIPN